MLLHSPALRNGCEFLKWKWHSCFKVLYSQIKITTRKLQVQESSTLFLQATLLTHMNSLISFLPSKIYL